MGCLEGKTVAPGVADAAGLDAGRDAGLSPAEAPPLELGVPLELLLVDGGTAQLPFGPVKQEIEPALGAVLRLPGLEDYRVRVFDGADKVLASDDEATASADGGLDYRLALEAPLKRGKEYRLLIDAELGPALADLRGQRYLDAEWNLKVVGEPEAPPARGQAPAKPGKPKRPGRRK